MAQSLLQERVWFDRSKIVSTEQNFYLKQTASTPSASAAGAAAPASGLASEISKVRERINQTLAGTAASSTPAAVTGQGDLKEMVNAAVKQALGDITARLDRLELLVQGENTPSAPPPTATTTAAVTSSAPAPADDDDDDDSDDDMDLFGSDDEETKAEAERVRQERLAAYAAKKAAKPGPVAKSNITFEVKPWGDDTDLGEMEKLVRGIEMDGLRWGASKLEPIGYGINKLKIICVVEDAKVSVDDLEELITGFEDHVQSVDIAAFQKV